MEPYLHQHDNLNLQGTSPKLHGNLNKNKNVFEKKHHTIFKIVVFSDYTITNSIKTNTGNLISNSLVGRKNLTSACRVQELSTIRSFHTFENKMLHNVSQIELKEI